MTATESPRATAKGAGRASVGTAAHAPRPAATKVTKAAGPAERRAHFVGNMHAARTDVATATGTAMHAATR